ncbi:ABC transporter substrate-binding protein [Cytophagales bacterium LB-30]|uniref:ABC transporter substrate-binding protein n=1 Tax=Shiella aurantiaca TaxID=3058365 RepID=A0ABT8F0N4_9BACT|nr:ABC transporter substrate-binding protein [Shiella aurantiaca]MDN4163993.1 ABC transporter substrate-binding protein [Shiella aurantiaca]
MKNSTLLLLISLVASSCGRFGNTDEKTDSQERIVCISKQYAEIIYALGAQKEVVAVDLSSTYPPEIKALPTIGYHRALSTETILAMKPSLILHDNNIGPEHVVTQLKELQIPMKTFGNYTPTIAGTDSLIREMGHYFGKEKQADSLCVKLHKEAQEAFAHSKHYTQTPKVLIIHFGRASNIYLVMTKNSTAAKLIEWAGGEMAVDAEKGMKQLSPEVVAAANPDIILLTDFGYDRLNDGKEIDKLPGISSTKAYKNNQIYRIEEHDLVYTGPRTGENVLRIQELIHPDETH